MNNTQHPEKVPGESPVFAYRRDIDGLRGIAVLLVLIFHFQLLPIGKSGFIGVDVFFVISGYLITHIITSQLGASRFSLSSFYITRLRRLAPGLAVVLSATMVWGCFRLLPSEFAELGRQVAAAQLYVSNFYYWRNYNYFGLGAGNVYLLHAWSLAVEEQFYLIYPLLLMTLHRWFKAAFWWCLAGLALASFLLNIAWVVPKAMNTFYLLPTRSWELLAGAVVSGLALPVRSRGLTEMVGLAAWILLILAAALYHRGIPVPGWFALLPVGATVGLIVSGADERTVTSRILSTRLLNHVGRVSYALYLVHWPIHVFAGRELGLGYGYGWRVAMFCLSFLAAHAVWKWVESPVRSRQVLVSSKALLGSYGVAVMLSLALASLLVQSGGWPSRLPARAALLDAYGSDRSPPLTECSLSKGWDMPPPDTCRIGLAGKPPTWIVVGDSHAWAGHAVFSNWLRTRGESGWLVYRHACPPLLNIHLVGDLTDSCGRFNTGVYEWAARSTTLDKVLLVSAWIQAREGALSPDPRGPQDSTKSLAVFSEQFDRSIRQLRAWNKQVWVWGPVPGAKVDVPHALAMDAWRRSVTDIEYTAAEHDEHFKFYSTAVERAGPMIAGHIDTARVLCASGRCSASSEGLPLYFDSAHMAASAQLKWSNVVEQALK